LLDTQTLAVVAIAIALVQGLIAVFVWQIMRSYPGRWVLGNFLASLSLILLLLRGTVPDWLSIVVANALAIGAALAFLQGIQGFRGLPVKWWPECALGALAVLGIAYFRYISDNINARIGVFGFSMCAIGIVCGIMLLKDMPRDRRIGLVITGLVFVVGAVVQLLRAVNALIFAPVTSIFDRTPVNSFFFLCISLAAVSWSLGFILITGDRLRIDSSNSINAGEKIALSVPEAPFSEAVPAEEVRQQLDRILESDVFRRSAQMERFLKLVVERSLLGQPEDLKEYVLGRDVFNRGEDYDPRADSIVRVEAQRLRRKLREYYGSYGLTDPISIDLPAGSYVAAFRYLQSRTIIHSRNARAGDLNG